MPGIHTESVPAIGIVSNQASVTMFSPESHLDARVAASAHIRSCRVNNWIVSGLCTMVS